MRFAPASLFLLGSLLAFGQPPIQRLDGSRISPAQADAFARKTLTAEHVTGAQLVVLNKGKQVWSAAYGTRAEGGLPMDRNTTTWIASITKSLFATYVMQLVERGQYDLDRPIAQQLPRPLNEYEPYKLSASELVKDPAWPLVTPRMLFAHTSGLLNFASQEPDQKMRLHSTPGTEYHYSGQAYNLLQFALEQETGAPLEKSMEDSLFAPLQMTQTAMIFRKTFETNIADRYGAAGQFLSQTRRFPARAAGSATSTAEDLGRFASALLTGKILQPKTLAEMFRSTTPILSLHQFPLAPNERAGAQTGLAYGVGWGLLTHTRFGPAFFKEGHGDGAQTYLICFTRPKSCMILLTNSDNGELAFRPLLEYILGDTVTPWEWEGYTRDYIQESRKH